MNFKIASIRIDLCKQQLNQHRKYLNPIQKQLINRKISHNGSLMIKLKELKLRQKFY
jgi:hypothetical protein